MIAEGDVIAGKYAIEAELGHGGMGRVYRARHLEVGRVFAIKILHAALVENATILARFRREAELAGRLRHENCVCVVDVGVTDDGRHYLVMEYAPGVPLATLLEGPMDEDRVLGIARQLCDGLQHAHDAGVIHRDFKPDNVIIEQLADGRDVARIVDFGVAIVRDQARSVDQERLTTKGIVVGTPRWMAPEQARGHGVDHRADLFALGLMLFEMLAGKPPFEGSGVEVARANVHLPTPPMGVRAPGVRVDPALEALVRTLLSKDPNDRLPNARAVREVLEQYERDRASIGHTHAAGRSRGPNQSAAPYQHLLEPTARPQQTDHDEPTKDDHKRIALIGIVTLLGTAVIGVGIFAALHSPASQRLAKQQQRYEAPVVVASSEPPPPETSPTGPVAQPTSTPAIPVPGKAAPVPRLPQKGSGAAQKPTPPPPAPTAPPGSAGAMATLYTNVGRELAALSKTDADLADSLWTRYRMIRFNEAIKTEASRLEAIKQLQALHAAAMATH